MFLRTLTLFLLLSTTTSAQGPAWSLTFEEDDIIAPMLSPGGLYFTFVDEDTEEIRCIDTQEGELLWSHSVKDFAFLQLIEFVGDSIIYFGNDEGHQFVRLASGEIVETIPLTEGDDWSDTRSYGTGTAIWSNNIVDVGFHHFYHGSQIFDLRSRSLLYASPIHLLSANRSRWGNIVMLDADSRYDSLVFFDLETRRYIFQIKERLPRMTQPFVTDDLLARREGRPVHELLLYSKKAITSFELPSGKVNARLPIEPGDLAFFFATPIGDRLALLATDDDSHTLYRTETGDPIWQISTERVPGIIDQIYEVGNGTLLLFVYDDSKTDLASIYQVQADDGTILWHRPIFKIGNYDAGNDALNRPFVHLSRAGRFGYEIDKETELVRYGAHDTLDDRMNVWRRVAGLQNELQNRGKDVSAYMDLVKIDGDAVLLAVGGRKARLLEREKGRKSAEGLYVLDLSTGTIVSSRPTEVLPETRYDDAPSLHLTVIPLDTIDEAVVISKSSVHLTNGDRFTHYDFGEGRVERIDTSGTPLPIFFGVHHDDVTEVWMIDVLADTLGAARVARSDEENVIFPFESRHIDRFIDYADGHLSSYPLSAGSMESDRLPAPTWSIDEDRIDAMDLGNITWNKNMLDPLYGIRLHDKGVLLAGEDAIAWISPDGSCTWKHEWQPNKKKIERAPMYLGDYLLYAVNGEQVIIRLDCDGTVVAEHEIDEAYDDLLATTEAAKATEHHTVILVDRDDNVIWCYHLP